MRNPLSQNYKIGRGEGPVKRRVSWGQPRLRSQESAVPAFTSFGGSPVFMPTPFNTERRNSAW